MNRSNPYLTRDRLWLCRNSECRNRGLPIIKW